MADLKIQGEVTLDTTKAEGAFARVESSAEKMASGVKRMGADAGKSVENIGAGADGAAQKLDRSTKSIVNSIQRVTAQMDAGDKSSSKYFEALAQQRGVSVDALKPYLLQLDAAKAKQDAATASLGNMGMSAKATAAALRGVPAQFTDIAVSLQGGQNPFTVLLQQGGQLKDQLGGVGNAARALGGYVLGLVNPFTLAAGAAGAIAVAAYQGSKELEAFNKTLILNGGASGVAADSLMSMADSISDVSKSVTQSKAASAIDEIVRAGVRGETQIKRFSLAAAEFEAAGGGAASEVAKNFEALAKEPLQASLKLTQSLGYLTEATYQQIKALEDQGRMVEAATIAQDAYADVIESRTPKLVDNLGSLQTAWNSVATMAKKAWDAMLNVGRADTLADQISAVEKRLDQARKNMAVGTGGGFDAYDPRRSADAALLDSLKEQQKLLTRSAAMTGERAQVEKERINFLAQGDKYLTSEQKQQKEILAVQQLRIKGIITEREEETRIAAIRAQSAKKGGTSTKAVKDEFGDLYNSLTMKDVGLDPSFYKDLNTLYEGYKKGRIGIDDYRGAVEKLVETQRFATDAQKAQATAQAAAAQSNNAAFDAEFAAIEKKRLANEAQIKNGREMLEQIQFETSLIGMNTQQREQAIAMRELERSGIVKGTQAYEAYAEAIKKGMMDRAAQQEMLDFWKQIDSTAESVFMDIAMNGEDAFKRIGESIKREVIQMLYEMTVKKWIFQIAGVSSGGGGGTDWMSLAGKAYDYYTGGATGAAASTYGSYAAAGGSYAASTVGDAAVVSYGSTAASGSAASGASAIYGYMGYAALIAAAVMVAENLYSKGYNRAALGYGNTSTGQIGQYSSYTSDPNISQSNMQYSPAMLMTTFDRTMMDALGVSEKWADIFSGTVRMATLVGRKLSGYGLEAEIVGGDVSVSGYADYKGGLFRSDKTVDVAVDERDANALKAQVEAMQQGTRAMAQAMGYSTEEIDNYTGSLKLNFKGVENSAEAAERLQKAMDDMQFSMLKAASGSNLSREEFDKFMEGVQASIEAAGISSAGIADILVQGMTGRLSEADVGDQLASTIVGGIYNAIAGQYAAVIAESFMASIITPIFTAITAGVPISQAISQAAIDSVVATAQSAAAALNAIFSRADFQAAIAGIEAAIGGVAGAATSINVPSFGTPTSVVDEVNEAEQERYDLETELLTLLGQTTVLRERELAALDESNQSLQLQIWALEDSKDAVDSAMDALTRAIESQREILQEQLTDALDVEQSLNDIFGILKDSIADLRGEVEGASAMSANAGMEAIRAAISGTEIDGETLSDAIDAVRTAIEDTTYETAFERDRAVLSFAGELSTLAGVTEKELSTAEQQVALLEEQLEALDVQLDTAQQQIDALYGVDTSVKSVEEAVTALTVAMAGYSAAVEAAALVSVSNGAAPEVSSSGGSSGGYSGSSGGSSSAEWTADGYWSKNPDLQAEYERLIGLDPSQSDPQFNKDPSLSYRDEYLKWHWETHGAQDKRKFAKGGAFTNGIVQGPTAFNMGLMGEAGPEAILPLTNVNGRLGVGSSDSKKTDELLQKVLREMESFHFNAISEAKAGNKMLKKWDGDGIPETREVTA
jgi:phage-related minor tail protein